MSKSRNFQSEVAYVHSEEATKYFHKLPSNIGRVSLYLNQYTIKFFQFIVKYGSFIDQRTRSTSVFRVKLSIFLLELLSF